MTMQIQPYQPVNEWNPCHDVPARAGDETWKNVVPDTCVKGDEATANDAQANRADELVR